jgi:hypothetical protein
MTTDKQLTAIGETFGKAIADLVRQNRAYSCMIKSVTDEIAYVVAINGIEPQPVPLTGLFFGTAAFKFKPNVGSTAIIQFANGDNTKPFFIAFSEIDHFSFTRGTTEIVWEMTPLERDSEGNEPEGETNDVVNLKIGESKLQIDTNTFKFNDGNLGGLVQQQVLKDQLAKVTARIDGVMDAIRNGVPVAQDGGAALQTSIVAELDLIVDIEDFSAIQNDKILQ